MNLENSRHVSIQQLQDRYLNNGGVSKTKAHETADGKSFDQILREVSGQGNEKKVTELKFSKHAQTRLKDRDIELDDTQLERLAEGADRAASKGIRDSLVMVDNLAFIVNIRSGVVVTAMDNSGTDDNIFTNIDGAVIM